MDPQLARSEFRVEKRRVEAVVRLTNGDSLHGSFFISDGSLRHRGGERVADVLNGDSVFFPFEVESRGARRTVLYNRAHVLTAQVFNDEARSDDGYAVARRCAVSVVLSTGQRIDGTVRVYRPEGRDRLSDWARQPDMFRYIESADTTLIVNAAHIVAITEVAGS